MNPQQPIPYVPPTPEHFSQNPNQYQNLGIHPINDPGKTLGIVGFVLAFIGLSAVGLVLSIIAYSKSKKVGINNKLSLAGIIVNAIFTIIFIPIAILTSITMVSYTGVTAKANLAYVKSNASSVISYAEVYFADSGYYPDEISDFRSGGSYVRLPSTINFLNSVSELNKINGTNSIVYQYSGEFGNATGGRIIYWDYVANRVEEHSYYAGSATKYSEFKNLE